MADAIPVHSTPAKGKKPQDGKPAQPVSPAGKKSVGPSGSPEVPHGSPEVSPTVPHHVSGGEVPVTGKPIKLASHDAIRVDN